MSRRGTPALSAYPPAESTHICRCGSAGPGSRISLTAELCKSLALRCPVVMSHGRHAGRLWYRRDDGTAGCLRVQPYGVAGLVRIAVGMEAPQLSRTACERLGVQLPPRHRWLLPELPATGWRGELTCCPDELPELAPWLASWLPLADPVPGPAPVLLSDAWHDLAAGVSGVAYVWTDAALRAVQERRRRPASIPPATPPALT